MNVARPLSAPVVHGHEPSLSEPGSEPSSEPRSEPMAETWQALKEERAQLDAREVALIMHALESSNGVIAHAARRLGIARTTLASRLDVLGVRPQRANS